MAQTIAVVQVKGNRCLEYSGSRIGGVKYLDSGYIVKVSESVGFLDWDVKNRLEI